MKLYVHRKTVRYYDYGELLETARGIAWSVEGDGKAENATGFERGRTIEDARRRFSELAPPEGWELLEGEPIERSFDMNPLGLI